MKKYYFCLFVLLLFYFFLCSKCKAESGHLLINEIFTGSETTDYQNQFIEIYNPTNETISLEGYYILHKTSYVDLSDLGKILPQNYLVLYKNDECNRDKVPYDLINFSMNYASDDSVSLLKKIDSSYQTVDSVSFNSNTYRSKSISRQNNGVDTDSDADFLISKPSPGQSRFLYQNEILISELFPLFSEQSSVEYPFVELYYFGKDKLELTEWTLKDKSGQKISLSGQLDTSQKYLLYSTNTFLNKTTAETVYLLDPNGDIKNTVSYSKPIIDKSYSFFFDINQYSWTSRLTPGADNLKEEIVLAMENIITPIAEVKNKSNGQKIKIQGNLSALPGDLSDQYFYIQDETGGIQIYSYYKKFPLLSRGDSLEISGEISEVNGEKRIKIDSAEDIKILNSGSPPTAVTRTELNQNDVGMKVIVEGRVDQPSGDQFYLLSGKSRIKVVVKNSDQVKKPSLKSGQKVSVSGICSIYKGELRILPFESGSVKIMDQNGFGDRLPEAGSSVLSYFFIYLILHIIWTLFLIMKKRCIYLQTASPKT